MIRTYNGPSKTVSPPRHPPKKGNTVTYQTLPLNVIPKRKAPAHEWDKEAAAALLGVVTADPIKVEGSDETVPPTATDGTAYADPKLARAEANKAKRLLGHVMPTGKIAKTVLFGLDKKGQPVLVADSIGSFGWAVYLADAPTPKAAPAE